MWYSSTFQSVNVKSRCNSGTGYLIYSIENDVHALWRILSACVFSNRHCILNLIFLLDQNVKNELVKYLMFDMQSAYHLIDLALREDLGEAGDLTSKATLSDNVRLRGRIVAKADGVIAGLTLVLMVFKQVDAALDVRLNIL